MRITIPYTNEEYANLAVYCNENNCHIEQTEYGLESVPNEPHIPTKEEQQVNREAAYVREVDILHAQKDRRIILGTWTDADEEEYKQKVITLSKQIAERYPYPEESED